MKLSDLLEKRSARIGRMRAIATAAETRGADLTDSERAEYDAAETEVRDLNSKIERAQRLDALERSAAATPINDNGRDSFETECRSYSLLRAIAHASGMTVDAGREVEISAEIARREGRSAQGIFAPQSILHVPTLERRVVISSTSGAGVIPTDHRDDLLVDALRASSIVNALGATVLNGLTGNVSIPAVDVGASGSWVAENGAISPADLDLNARTLTPKHVGCITEFSRNMILQSSPDVENLARRDFARALASALDSAALVGGGANEPSGVIDRLSDASALGTWATPTHAQGLELIAAVEAAAALGGSVGWALHPYAKKKLMGTLVAASTDSRMIMSDPNSLYGYRALSSPHAGLFDGSPEGGTSAAIFGDWTSLIVGYWGGVEILANAFETTAFSKGNVQIRGLLSADCAVRTAQSFAAAIDIPQP